MMALVVIMTNYWQNLVQELNDEDLKSIRHGVVQPSVNESMFEEMLQDVYVITGYFMVTTFHVFYTFAYQKVTVLVTVTVW